jgi:ABC-type nitrate/sulfonate/bicarbonate transport system permease component
LNFKKFVLPLIFIFVWSLISSFSIINPLFLASPRDVIIAFWELSSTGRLLIDITSSLQRVIITFVISSTWGVILGLLIGRFSRLRDYLEFPIEFFRVIPAPAPFPSFYVVFWNREFGQSSRGSFCLYLSYNGSNIVWSNSRKQI